jgi:hypothetical protein
LDDLGQSPLYSNKSEEQVFLAQDEFRQRQIQQENEMAEAGLQTLSNHPAWNDIQAKVCALNATALKRPFSGNIHSERKWAFERFHKHAKLYLRTVTDTPTADAFCGILPILARVAFWECRMGRPPQYSLPVSADAVSFELEVAAQIELAKKTAYKKASKRTNIAESKAGLNKQRGERQEPIQKAICGKREYSPKVNEIAARSKQELFEQELAKGLPTDLEKSIRLTSRQKARGKIGRPTERQTRDIRTEWTKMGSPKATAAICDKIGKQFFAEELKESQPGSPGHKRVRERVRKAIERSGANPQHNYPRAT